MQKLTDENGVPTAAGARAISDALDRAREQRDAREHTIAAHIPPERRGEAMAAANQAGDAFARLQVLERYAAPVPADESAEPRWTDAARSPLLRRDADEVAEVTASHTRAQLAAAVDEAHDHLHAWTAAMQSDDAASAAAHVEQAHEALHLAGAGQPRIACATLDPEAQAMAANLRAMLAQPMPCGHQVGDLVYAGPSTDGLPGVCQCGRCLADKLNARHQLPRTPERVLRAMLRVWEEKALSAAVAWAPSHVLDGWGSPDVAAVAACVAMVRVACAFAVVGRSPVDMLSVSLARDYEARLRGDRPLNAPPAEV